MNDDLTIIQNLLKELGFDLSSISLDAETFDKQDSHFQVTIRKVNQEVSI